MGKELVFSIGGIQYAAEPSKLDRKKLYGYREQIALDDDNALCSLVSMSECGTIVIPKGGTGLGFLSADGKWVERSQIKTVKLDGSPASLTPSSFSGVITLDRKATPEELLDCSVAAFYKLAAPNELLMAIGKDLYRFEYCFRDSYETSAAFLITSENGGDKELFMLVGPKAEFPFIGYEEIAVFDEDNQDDDESEGEDGIDFSMF